MTTIVKIIRQCMHFSKALSFRIINFAVLTKYVVWLSILLRHVFNYKLKGARVEFLFVSLLSL